MPLALAAPCGMGCVSLSQGTKCVVVVGALLDGKEAFSSHTLSLSQLILGCIAP